MSLFEFLMVLVSLIIGLGLAELLTGVAKTIRNRDNVKLYWVHITFLVIVFFALLQTWWEVWGVREAPSWTFIGLIMMLGGPIGLFLIAHLLFPEQINGADFKKHYYNKMRPVLWLGIITVVISTAFRPMIMGSTLFAMDNASSFFFVITFLFLALSKNKWLHSILVPCILMGILADILLVSNEIS